MGSNQRQGRVLASLSPDELSTLAELVATKLQAKTGGCLLPKQDVAGSNPVTRSIKLCVSLGLFTRS